MTARRRLVSVKPHHTFNPVRVGTLEAEAWVAYYRDGCDLASPLVGEERAALVRSFAALLAAVHLA